MSLKITAHQDGNDQHLALYGMLDENCQLPEFDHMIAGKLVVNLEFLTMINSLGTRKWLKWIKSIKAQGGVVLSKCSAPFIAQVNVLHNFTPEGVYVESFQVPYLCPTCTHEAQLLFTVARDTEAEDTHPCPACGGTMEMDVIKSKYFNFLKKKVA
jgi:hypothetical protein